MVTSPVANIVTGVLAALGIKLIVTPLGIFTVVKLNTPLGGTCTFCVEGLLGGANAPSAPVEPLLKLLCADAGTAIHIIIKTIPHQIC
jgi:hypothetical protein